MFVGVAAIGLGLQEKGGRAPVHESKINSMCAANRASLEVRISLWAVGGGVAAVDAVDAAIVAAGVGGVFLVDIDKT